jgi:S1-C subfamily serine protease
MITCSRSEHGATIGCRTATRFWPPTLIGEQASATYQLIRHNSGGPLLDSAGNLIGMNTMIFSKTGSSAGIGFAVPSRVIARIVPQIIATGHAEELGFGIEIDPNQRVERRLGLKGVIILSVLKGTSADTAGLHGITQTSDGFGLGDVVVGIGGSPVGSYDDFYNALDEHHAGDELDVKIVRAGHVVTARVTLTTVGASPQGAD